MDNFNLLAPLLLAIVGLLVGAILKSILKKTGFPYTVGLFALGLGIGLLDRFDCLDAMPRVERAITTVGDINPDFILYVFLPILIFDAAYEMNMHIFKKTLANSTLLAVPGLIVCMLLTALVMIGISLFVPEYSSWTWPLALMFGALISATDPVAVVALLHELGTSKRFSTLVDGESLLNDGTGIVCFMLFFGAYTLEGASADSPAVQFLKVVMGGVLLGYCMSRLTIWFITRINSEEVIQNSVIILSAYVTFILSQYYMGISGVIALVTFGLVISYVGRPRLKPQVNAFMEKFWELLTHIANTLVFIMVGVVIAEKVDLSWSDLLILLLVYVALNLIRFAMITLFYPVMKRLGYGLTKRESVILTWGGLRGALGMTLALMVSYTPGIPEDIRRQILFLTAGIVTLTLSVNATTMRWLLNRLGLTQIPNARLLIDTKVATYLRESAEKYAEKLAEKEPLSAANWNKVRKYLPDVSRNALPQTPQKREFLSEIRLRVLDREKTICRKIYEEGVISKTTFLHIMNSLDEMYDHDGQYALDFRPSIFKYCNRTSSLPYIKDALSLGESISLYFRERIVRVYDMARGFIILQNEDLSLLNELGASDLLTAAQKEQLATLRGEIERNINRMNDVTKMLAQNYPKAFRHALTVKSIRMLLTYERRTIRKLQNDGVISEKDAERLIEKVDERTDEGNSFRYTVLGTLLRGIVHGAKKKGTEKQTPTEP